MNLSKTSAYAIRILAFMAKNPKELYSAKYLIQNLEISDKYLRKLMTELSKSGFIISIQGRNGGYKLDKQPTEILLQDIVENFDGIGSSGICLLGLENCENGQSCIMGKYWSKIHEELSGQLKSRTIADLFFE